MTPAEAEAQAIRSGLPSFIEGYEETHDITVNSTWWLPVALLFYAWRDLGKTRREFERFEVWGRDLWRDPKPADSILSLQEAEQTLRGDLVAGIVRAFGTNLDAEVMAIPAREWRDLQFAGKQSLSACRADGSIVYSGVFVLRHEVVPLWLQETPVALVAPEPIARERADQPVPKRGGGRPAIHDWAGAAGYATAHILENDYPAVESDLTQALATWFSEERGKSPDPRDVQRFVAEIYKNRRPTPAG